MRLRLVSLSVALVGAAMTTVAAVGPSSVPAPTFVVASAGGVSEGHRPDRAQAALYGDVPAATFTAADYDGKAFTTDQPDLLPDLPQVHVVYVHAADQPSRFTQFAPMFQAEDRRTSKILASVMGRGLRWDERLGSDGIKYHDMTVLKSAANSRKLSGNTQFSQVVSDLAKAKLNKPNKKYLVWLDASSQYCGQSQFKTDAVRSPANANEGTSVSAVYVYYDRSNATGGFCAAQLHELNHAMGAVQPAATNSSGGHCSDHGNDTMCSGGNPRIPYDGTALRYYDYNNDDYADAREVPGHPESTGTAAPKLGWWTVNLSRFLCAKSSDPGGIVGCDQAATPNY